MVVPRRTILAGRVAAQALTSALVAEDLSSLDAAELERRVGEVRERMRPHEQELAGLDAPCGYVVVANDAAAGASADRRGRIWPIKEFLKGRGKRLSPIEPSAG